MAGKDSLMKCKNCRKEFKKKRPWHDFCSASCRTDHWQKEHPRLSIEEMKKVRKILKLDE